MLEMLEDEYGYEDGGYATWLFRSGAQDGKYAQPSRNEYKILSITQVAEDIYEYTALDDGWRFTNWIRLVKSGNTVLIDDVDILESELAEDY